MWTRTGQTHTNNRQPPENSGSWWWWRWYERILGLMLKHHISFLYPRRIILFLSLRMSSSLPIALLWLTTFDCNHFAACEFCWWIHTLTHPQSEAVVVFVFPFCNFQLISLTWNESSENTRIKKKVSTIISNASNLTLFGFLFLCSFAALQHTHAQLRCR